MLIAHVALDDSVVGQNAEAGIAEEVLASELPAMQLGRDLIERTVDIEHVQRIVGFAEQSKRVSVDGCAQFR